MTTEEPPPAAAPGGDGGKKKEKKVPEGLVIPKKKPKLSKAERRALQESQRAEKAGGGPVKKGAPEEAPSQNAKSTTATTGPTTEGSATTATQEGASSENATAADKAREERNTIALFSHLPPYQDPKSVVETGPRLWPKPVASTAAGTSASAAAAASTFPLHPAVIELGYKYSRGDIRGGNARCRAMLRVFHQAIGDFQPPPPSSQKKSSSSLTDMRHQLDQWVLKPSFQYWTTSCRPHSVTMGNAFTFLKTAVASLERDMSRDAMVEMIQDTIEAYIRERIDLAQQAIAHFPALQLPTTTTATSSSSSRNKKGGPQVFLTYGNSEAIAAIFLRMAEISNLSDFRVIVVDSRPLLEGKALLRTLRAANIDCTYILLNALTYVMRDVTKVYLGASALMSDGGLLGRVGTACVALSAHMHHIPVLVCCESYKISNRVQLESITGNELGDPSQVAVVGNSSSNIRPDDDGENDSVLKDWLDMDNLRLLNLLYDLTPSEFVSGIVTELGIIPPTSVAVLLREMNAQN